jgi:outer membrane lipoprotein SlyB
MKVLRTAGALACVGLLAACAYPGMGAGDYTMHEAQGEQQVRFGVVESVREVRIDPYDSGVGTVGGAMVGGIAGSHVGGGSGEVVGAIAGTILGGIIGQNIEKSANTRMGIEVTVLLDSGKYVAIVQQADEVFRAGDRVRVISGRRTRVTH